MKGYIAFTTLLIVGAVSLSVALSVSILSIGEGQMSLSTKKGQQVFYLAESCIEDSLEQIKNNNNYNGGSFNIFDGSCTININKQGNNWIIIVSAIKDNFEKKIETQITKTGGNIILNSWKEI